ncbi:Methylcrotonoyl-CoA carboxylase subunit alpha [Lasiodiplodia theobromae]|uniref:Methylcrotonoyl-CoA carboxylase subunit alpha n=1 Tax=Lasiodiplodia theobromae TaxID=45133 RepID=A0A5N5DAS2_9PEZI|nr:Methylcrotonoyl-CoA carboxylase subunit alpha [Lasiodiplodia theobromae]
MDDASSNNQRRPLFVAEPPAGPDGRPVLRRILIANRGEIACRIISTCRKLNLTSIAVYVDEDITSLHIHQADESIRLGSLLNPQQHDDDDKKNHPTNPFLSAPLLVRAALAARADAVHPGYGYLSEDPSFAEAVRAAGLVFIGPTAQAMRTLGNKRAAKAHLRTHAPDVPLIPGLTGSASGDDGDDGGKLEAAVTRDIGFPVMLKAAAGGGGKGMRVVRAPHELRAALARARSEAARSFGSADCIVEKYVAAAKHVEVQIVGDRHGKVVALGERDCSVQRRHQKIVEETPCPWLAGDEDMRARMAATAVRVAELIGYEGAGTVEFVVDVEAREYYFLEVNARLQVEHPITEEVAGVDLVALQFFVAAGGRLDSLPALDPVQRNGHAIECRLCAEDPYRDFLPERGTVRLWRPAVTSDVRFETAIQTGSDVSIHFDPMIGKIVVWAPTRLLALEKMIRVLAQTACVGVRTNQLFLQACLMHPAFRDPSYTTSFIPSNLDSLLQSPYAEAAKALQDAHHIAPCLFLRHLRAEQRFGQPFPHVRRGFRNQRCDPINQHVNVVKCKAAAATKGDEVSPDLQPPSICIIQQADPTDNNSSTYRFHIAPVPSLESPDGPEKSIARLATAQYNALSTAVRQLHPFADTATAASVATIQSLTPIQAPVRTTTADTNNGWLSSTVAISVNGQKLLAHMTAHAQHDDSSASQIGRPQTFYAHVPALGTWVEYEVYSLLSFAESQRMAVEEKEGGGKGAAARVVKAPMPCRVLDVLKNDGDDVKSGENVMVVESMKMEMSIVVSVDGKFKTTWRKGDAVSDGAVLCRVE